MKSYAKKLFVPVYDNDVAAFIPEVWALEGISLLSENMVGGFAVTRDYENEIADFGDVVNVSKVKHFEMRRKGANDSVYVQNAEADNIPVPMNQHLHTSFMIKDSEMSLSRANLFNKYLRPATLAISSGMDRIITGASPWFLQNAVGQLGGFDATNAVPTILQARKMMNDKKMVMGSRYMLVDTATEATILNVPQFTNANQVGDDGTAMREASIGRKYGANFVMGQNIPYVNAEDTQKRTGAVNAAAGYGKGATAINVDGITGAIVNGTYVTIEGSMYPYRVTASVGGATPTQITIAPALRNAVVDNAVVTIYTPVAIDNAAGYVNGYVKEIHIDGYTKSPQIGQIITDKYSNVYTISEIYNDTGSECDVLTNVPLKGAMVDNDPMFLGPAGSYNFGVTPEALALVTRPLAMPSSNLADGAVISDEQLGLSLRVVATYDGTKQGTLVTVDMLCGITPLDINRALVMLG